MFLLSNTEYREKTLWVGLWGYEGKQEYRIVYDTFSL